MSCAATAASAAVCVALSLRQRISCAPRDVVQSGIVELCVRCSECSSEAGVCLHILSTSALAAAVALGTMVADWPHTVRAAAHAGGCCCASLVGRSAVWVQRVLRVVLGSLCRVALPTARAGRPAKGDARSTTRQLWHARTARARVVRLRGGDGRRWWWWPGRCWLGRWCHPPPPHTAAPRVQSGAGQVAHAVHGLVTPPANDARALYSVHALASHGNT
jgi:hypothetical protein